MEIFIAIIIGLAVGWMYQKSRQSDSDTAREYIKVLEQSNSKNIKRWIDVKYDILEAIFYLKEVDGNKELEFMKDGEKRKILSKPEQRLSDLQDIN